MRSRGCAGWAVALTLVLAGSAAGAPPPIVFGPPADFAAGSGPAAVAAGHFNGDGNLDLVVANANSNTISLLLGDGAGGFGAASTFAVGAAAPVAVVVGRLRPLFSTNNDVVTANQGSDSVTVFYGDGAGGFSSIVQLAVDTGPRMVAIADMNGDGVPDLVTVNAASVTVLLGSLAGGFPGRVDTPVSGGPTSMAVASFGPDGIPDLAVTRLDDTVLILLGDGIGSFTAGPSLPVGTDPASVIVADVNGDAFLDLVVANQFGGGVSILLNDGAGGFLAATSVAVGTEPTGVAWADFNLDGVPDLAVSNTGSSFLTFLAGDGTGAFPARFDVTGGAGPAAPVAVGDFDNDGGLDVAVVRTEANVVTILLNKSLADAAVSVVATPGPGLGAVVFTIDVSNGGPGPAQTVTVTDATPAGTTFASIAFTVDPGVGVSCLTPLVGGTGAIVCTIDSLPAGSVATFVLTVTIGPGGAAGPIVGTATAFAATFDVDLTNNTASAAAVAVGAPTLGEWAQILLAGVMVAMALWALRRRARAGVAAGLVVLGLGLPAWAETIGGFCRQSGSFAIRAFSLDTVTGVAQMLAAPALGADRAGHFAAATDLTDSTLGSRMVVGLSSQTTGSPAVESLVTVNTGTGAVQPSTGTLPSTTFTGHAMSTMLDPPSWTILTAQRGPTQLTKPSTDVFQIDVGTAAVGPQANAVFTAALRQRYTTLAQPFHDSGISLNTSWLLQPCDLPVNKQELVQIDRSTMPWTLTTVQLDSTTCLQAPGAMFGAMYALTDTGSGITFVGFDSAGAVLPLPLSLPGWRLAPASPYVYSRATLKLYVLDDTQTLLATYDPFDSFTATLTPITKPPACGDASITSFAGMLP